MRFYETASVLFAEQDQLELDIQDFVSGKIDPVKFRAIRVAHGVYEQRKEQTYMMRIRCAAGGITPTQLRKVADLAKRYGSGEVHVTTRQDVQIHYARVENLLHVIRGLNEVGLSTRGGGGNTIRNILTPQESGIDPTEEFDVDPYAIALTTRLIGEPDSWNLPRKFKVNFSNAQDDRAYTQATCLGFIAKIKDGVKGFNVYCAGGMGAKPMVGDVLLDWVPDTQVYHISKALKIMFDRHGNRRSRNTNRIKFLWKKIGAEEFKALFFEEYNKIKDDLSLALKVEELDNTAKVIKPLTAIKVSTPEYELWKKRFTFEQKQKGSYSVKVPLKLGDIEYHDVYKLCDLLDHFGENTIRCSRDQNLQLRNIPEDYLGNVYEVIRSIDTLSDKAAFVGNMINCTGASTCKLGICLPRGLSSAITERLSRSTLALDELKDFHLNMSGCPNTCGMHHVADLGFFGKVGRKSGKMFPAYNILAGAKIGYGQTAYAEKVDELNAKSVPDFVHDFLEHYLSKKTSYENYQAYLEAEGKAKIKEICDKYRDIPDFDVKESNYIDFGAKKPLSLDEIGTAECSAGMFDMIDVDQKNIKLHQKRLSEATSEDDIRENLHKILFHASRMLLVTRGLDAKEERDAFELFHKHFIETELVDKSFGDVVTLAKLNVLSELPKHGDKINELGEAVIALYKSMDDSLRFTVEKKKAESAATATAVANDQNGYDKFMDYRGVGCPMNFVKTKIALAPMDKGQKLKIFLDDGEPIQNVPNSVKLEGHKILKQAQDAGGHWEVLIEKV